MVCKDCRDGRHRECKERRRQKLTVSLTDAERAASPWCDCKHEARSADH